MGSLYDDEEGNRAEWYEDLLESEEYNLIYGGSDSAPWWHHFEKYQKACKNFLMSLAVNPMWYMTLLHGDHTVRCCYCPFHKRFEPYFRKMNVQFFLDYLKVTPCRAGKNGVGRFHKKEAFLQHCTGQGGWHHKMMMFFVRKLFDPEPDDYPDDLRALLPDKDGTETVDKIRDGTFVEEDYYDAITVNSIQKTSTFFTSDHPSLGFATLPSSY